MIDIINSKQIYTSPTTYCTIQYEYKREGADMYYRFYWKVWLTSSAGFYDYGLALKFFLDGVEHSVRVKDETLDHEYQWSKSGTTEWYKVANKTTGTTSFYAQLYDTSRKMVIATTSTFALALAGAASVLGTIKDFNVGDGIQIPITKYDSTFTDTLVVSYGGTTVYTLTGAQQGTVVWFSKEQLSTIYGLMANVKSGTFTFTLTTKTGNTTLGSSTKTATGTITNADPTFTASQVTYADTNDAVVNITGNAQQIVQNKSHLTVYLGLATGINGASISKYEVTVNGVTKSVTTNGSVEFGTVNTSQNTDITVVVTDSRGNKVTVTKKVTVLAYATPTFAVTLERLNNYEDETYLTVEASISSVDSKNAVTITYKKKQNGGSYESDTTLTNRRKHTTSCDKDYVYVFSVTVSDKFESVTRTFTLPKGRFPLFIDTARNAVGINEFPSEGEALRVAGGVACFEGGIVAGYGQYINTDCNNVTKNGWYYVAGASNAASPYDHAMLVVAYGYDAVTQIAFMGNSYSVNTVIVIRKRTQSGWNEWEYLNPPMALNVEYRTTERYEGAPVYTQLVDLGTTTASMSNTVSIEGIGRLIRAVPNLNNAVCTEWDGSSGANTNNKFYFCPEKNGSAGVAFYVSCGSLRTGKSLKAQIWYTKN